MAIETNKDFDLKFTRNPISNDVVLKIDRPDSNLFPSIQQSLRNILMTSRGERRFNPSFGGDLQKTLFELIRDFDQPSVIGEINIREVIKLAIQNHEPRITLLNIKFDNWDEMADTNRVDVYITYSVPPSAEVLTYTLGIKRVK